jgi:4-amino-4-deoxy-L-arabinose transferase-like glycosyltransferase
MLLCGLVAWAMWWWVRAFGERRPRLYLPFFLFAGLATLAKGPVGLLPPLLAVVAFLLATGRRRELGAMRIGRGLAAWAAVVAAWLVPAAVAGGGEYARTLLFRQNVTRFAEPWHHLQPWHYYLSVIPAEFLPWSLLLPTALFVGWRAWGWRRGGGDSVGAAPAGGEAVRGDARDGFRWALVWALATLVFFSLSPGKRSVYVFSMYPALALLVGAALDRLATAWTARAAARPAAPSPAWLTVPFAVAAALFAAAAAALPIVWQRRPEAAWLGDPFGWSLATALVTLALAAAVAVRAAARRRVPLATASLAAGMAVAVLIAAFRLLPAMDVFKSARPLAAAFVDRTDEGIPFAVYPRLDNTVLFYTGRPAVPVDSPEALRDYLRRPEQGWVFAGRHDLEWLRVAELPLARVAADPPVERNGYVLLAEVPSGP